MHTVDYMYEMLCLTIILSLLYQAVFCFADSHVAMGADDLQSGNQSEQKSKPSETKTEILDKTSQHPQGKGVTYYMQLHHCDMYVYLPHMLMYMYICFNIHSDTNSHDSEVVLQSRDSHSITSDDEDSDSKGTNPGLYMSLYSLYVYKGRLKEREDS